MISLYFVEVLLSAKMWIQVFEANSLAHKIFYISYIYINCLNLVFISSHSSSNLCVTFLLSNTIFKKKMFYNRLYAWGNGCTVHILRYREQWGGQLSRKPHLRSGSMSVKTTIRQWCVYVSINVVQAYSYTANVEPWIEYCFNRRKLMTLVHEENNWMNGVKFYFCKTHVWYMCASVASSMKRMVKYESRNHASTTIKLHIAWTSAQSGQDLYR